MKIRELGHVVLYVTNLEKSLHFYRDILGFPVVMQQPGMAMFSAGRTHHEMLLIEIGGVARPKFAPEPGLYHIGFRIGENDAHLRAACEELTANNIQLIGATDHGATHSLYLADPDGNEIELYIDAIDNWKDVADAGMTKPRALRL